VFENSVIRSVCRRIFPTLSGLVALVVSPIAFAYGPEGHLIAGRVAQELLCERTRAELVVLGAGEDLGELGLWADRIRSDQAFADSGPWHYLNIASGVPLAAFEHPSEGDVLWAIQHFSDRLRDESIAAADRAEALKFLVHFIVDLHQPLHVGLAADRGGNAVRVGFRGQASNLHRLWDTHAIEWTGLSVRDYSRQVRREVLADDRSISLNPLVWAEESLALRSRVYDFGEPGREPDAAYMDFAASTTRDRLVQAARRLAGTLDAILCS
jgi:hypothetical protein